jgi:hypothetical protein
VLDEYADYLPLTGRQVLYRLMGAHDFGKGGYGRLLETLNRARRAGLIAFEAIRDDGAVVSLPTGFHGLPEFWGEVRSWAEAYERDRSEGQPVALEVWCEAAGMVPQLERAAHPFGVGVYSSGGFDSVTVKHDAARRFVARTQQTVVLHVGDYDWSGCAIADSLTDDVAAFVRDLGGPEPRFVRVAVTPEQIDRYQLPTAPDSDDVQAEALAPDQLALELDTALRAWIDEDVLAKVIAHETEERAELEQRVARLAGARA